MTQEIFKFDMNEADNLDDFIVSNSNSLAYQAINTWPQDSWGTAPYPKTLIIRGPKSSGKTLLAKQWIAKSNAIWIPKNELITADILDASCAFVLEDLDIILDEENILHHFNSIHEHNKHLLITTTVIPSMILPDLQSRINATNIIDINLPDDQLIKMLIFKIFSYHSVLVSQEIIEYLLKILPREFDSIIASVNHINNYALKHKHKVTIPLIKQALDHY
ncbi:MAG: DnaA/Hda family protein [Rickettsiaceae bacterium]